MNWLVVNALLGILGLLAAREAKRQQMTPAKARVRRKSGASPHRRDS